MTDRPEKGIQEVRDGFRTIADDALERGIITVVKRHGRPIAAVVPFAWLERADAALAKEEHEGT